MLAAVAMGKDVGNGGQLPLHILGAIGVVRFVDRDFESVMSEFIAGADCGLF